MSVMAGGLGATALGSVEPARSTVALPVLSRYSYVHARIRPTFFA
jgi:hypothetical protein